MTKLPQIGVVLIAPACLLAIGWLTPVLAQDLPFHQRPGLWLNSMTMMGKQHTSKECISAESLAFGEKFSAQVRKNNHCTANHMMHNADGSWSDSFACTDLTGKQTVTQATYRGDPNSKFITTMTEGNRLLTTSTFTYAGACPAGMHGGDVEMDGHTMNMMTMSARHR